MKNLELANRVLEVIPLAMRFMRSAVRKLQREGLTFPHYRMIAYLKMHPEASNRDLAEWQGVNVATMSRNLDGLIERGLIRRKPSPSDRREVRFELTGKGENLRQGLHTGLAKLLETKLITANNSDKESLETGLKVLGELFK